MDHARLVEVADIIEFVAEFRILEPAFLVDPRMGGGIRVHGAPGVKVSVRFLGGGDAGDDRFKAFRQIGVGFHAQTERGSFEHLEDIRVIEGVLGGRLVLEGGFAGGAAFHGLGGEVEVEQALG